jgi:virulence factor Mce-like protein
MSSMKTRIRQSMAVIGKARKAGIDAPKRHIINVSVFMGLSAILIVYVAMSLLFQGGGERTLSMEFANASGINIRGDVTMRGVPVGIVSDVQLTARGTALVTVALDPGMTVAEGTKAQIIRRSAIGDVTLEMDPGTGPPIPNRGHIPMSDTTIPPDPERTIELLAQVLHSVPSEDLTTVVSELAQAVQGRGQDLATLAEAGAQLPGRILEVQRELESLIVNGPDVTGVLAANADTLADDLTQTALLADILRDRRFDLLELSENGALFAGVAADLIIKDKANISCLLADLARVNGEMAAHQDDLVRTLENNHFFFDGVWGAVQTGKDGLDWFRVQLVPPAEPMGLPYEPNRPAPDVHGGNSCQSKYGPGVKASTQPKHPHLAPGSKLILGD